MGYTLNMLIKFANGIAGQFGADCEVVIHDLKRRDLEHSIAHIINGHVSGRKEGDGPSKIVLRALNKAPSELSDHIGYFTKTSGGRFLKSTTFFIPSDDGTQIDYILAINYDVTGLIAVENTLKGFTRVVMEDGENGRIEPIYKNVHEILDSLMEQSVELIGKPVGLMTKEEKVKAIKFLNNAGAFLITKSGDKISKFFGISKYTLYSYVDVKNRKS